MHTAVFIAAIILAIYIISKRCDRIDRSKLLPVSGFEPSYMPLKWNIPPMILTHNCYDYAFNNYSVWQKESSQPGYIRSPQDGVKLNESENRMTCAGVNERLNNDHGSNITVASRNIPCEQGKYKIALIADPNDDYHFLRQNKDGTWSHKPGNTSATNRDFSGKIIVDPERADFNSGDLNYSDFCNYFCVGVG
jgi:hypothetical protein